MSKTLPDPRIVGEDSNPSRLDHTDLSSETCVPMSPSSDVVHSSQSQKRAKLAEMPARTAESHKESRKAKRQTAKRGSVKSTRTAEAEAVSNAVTSDAPVASQARSSGGGFLRRMASFSGMSRKNV